MSKIFVASAYGSYPQYLNLVTKYYKDNNILLVVIGMDNLYKFYSEINKKCWGNQVTILYIPSFKANYRDPKLPLLKRLFSIPADIIRERVYLREIYGAYFYGYKNADVYFSLPLMFSGLKIWLVRKLGKHNNLIGLDFTEHQERVVIQNEKHLRMVLKSE